MSKREYGMLHLAIPYWKGDTDHFDQAVVRSYRYGRSHLDVAIELWELAGHGDRAVALRELKEVAFGREVPLLHTDEVATMLGLLDGLDDALKKITGPQMLVPLEQLPALRARVKLVDLDADRGDLAVDGVSEAAARVWELRRILKEALAGPFDLVFD
jgi:hypothetical protein